jgi:alcohol dehydrogenase
MSVQSQFSATRVITGSGVIASVGSEAKGLGMSVVMLLIDPFFADTPAGNAIQAALSAAGLTVVRSTAVEPDPSAVTIQELAAWAAQHRIDGIVAVGGGSAIDTAKAVGLLRAHDVQHIAPFYHGGGATPAAMLPLIAVPTTAGTGSEVTFVAIVTEPSTQRKLLIRHPVLTPAVALVDPDLTATMPAALTMATGMDALAHSLESLTSTMSSPMSDALAGAAIDIIVPALPRLVRHGHNPTDRAAMSTAATIAGMAFLSGRLHLGHAVGHALGGAYHVPHGPACVVLMPQIMALVAPARPDATARIATAFGCTVGDLPATLQRFMVDCGAPNLRTLIAPHSPSVAELIALFRGEERLINLSPIVPTTAQWESMIQAAW